MLLLVLKIRFSTPFKRGLSLETDLKSLSSCLLDSQELTDKRCLYHVFPGTKLAKGNWVLRRVLVQGEALSWRLCFINLDQQCEKHTCVKNGRSWFFCLKPVINLLALWANSFGLSGLEISHLANECIGLGHWFLILFPILSAQLKNKIMAV